MNNDSNDERQLKRALRIRNAAEKLISFLESKSECHEGKELLQNTFDESVEKFVKNIETATELYSEKCLPITDGKLPVPELIRNKINQLLKEAEDDGNDVSVSVFLDEIEKTTQNDILRNICEDDDEPDDFVGLDCDRDTEEEVENIIRLFPEALDEFPGVFWCDRLRDIPFIPLMVRLRIELCDDLDEDERGGLLDYIADDYYLKVLERIIMAGANLGINRFVDARFMAGADLGDVDDRLLTTMRRLKDNGHLHRSDIEEFSLFDKLIFERRGNILEKVFWFLVDWDPELFLPSHYRAYLITRAAGMYRNCTLKAFQLVFEAGIRYFPSEEGINILFRKGGIQYYPMKVQYFRKKGQIKKRGGRRDIWDSTLFELACSAYGSEEVWKTIESTWIKYSNDPYGFAKNFFIAAADKDIALDEVYFALRREPDALAKLLSGNLVTASKTMMMEETNSGNNANTIATGRNKRKLE